jgi:predicted nucleic acid-binding protein
MRSGTLGISQRACRLHSCGFGCQHLDAEIAHKVAELRAKFNLRTPDAIQLATAIHAKAQVFVTNDERLRKVKDVPVLIIKEYQTPSRESGSA